MNNKIPLALLSNNNLDKWLNKVLNNYETTIQPYKSDNNKQLYYDDINDIDFNANDEILSQIITNMTDTELDENPELKKLNEYMDHILINPDTNRYHANLLFRQLIDFSHENDFNYKIYNDITNEYDKKNLLNKSMKKSFYEFCYNYS